MNIFIENEKYIKESSLYDEILLNRLRKMRSIINMINQKSIIIDKIMHFDPVSMIFNVEFILSKRSCYCKESKL